MSQMAVMALVLSLRMFGRKSDSLFESTLEGLKSLRSEQPQIADRNVQIRRGLGYLKGRKVGYLIEEVIDTEDGSSLSVPVVLQSLRNSFEEESHLPLISIRKDVNSISTDRKKD